MKARIISTLLFIAIAPLSHAVPSPAAVEETGKLVERIMEGGKAVEQTPLPYGPVAGGLKNYNNMSEENKNSGWGKFLLVCLAGGVVYIVMKNAARSGSSKK